MKKTTLLMALSATLLACQQSEDANANAKETKEIVKLEANVDSKTQEMNKNASALEFKDLNEKAAYSIGQNFAKQMSTNFESLVEYDISIDRDLVLKGIKDGFAGKGQFDDATLQANMQEFQSNIQAKMAAKQEVVAAEAKMKAEANKKIGQAFEAEYAKKESVKKTETGLLYKTLTKGKGGAKPTAEDVVKVHYKGTFIDGKQFDSSYDRGEPTSFPLNGVIKGWTEGLQLMEVGDKFEFVIPAAIAYGSADRGNIPGNSTLVFEVELLDINPDAK